ncbi:MAG: ectonucleotide pyrophosphatase/phosphodiesterase [Acidobacteriota bacterium]|nr:ectonucleotide pyrophosphatase/phosphodiesterase [Blastocatellia bacterium]MDW8413375.1 ectonucleotide pyrophosphatase/phosphodiesterase [Acidobacteriota bacterium]
MMRLAIYFLVLLSILLPLRNSAATQQNEKTSSKHVVVISVDGMIPDYYLNPSRYGLKIPTIRQLLRQGSYAEAMQTIYPSLTYPSHTTLVTGVTPAKHGIYSNLKFSPLEKGTEWYWFAEDIQVPTLWTEARKRGLTTAAIGWPVTVGAEIDFHLPEYWKGNLKATLKLALEGASPSLRKRLELELKSDLDDFSDELRTRSAEIIIRDYKPNLVLLHLFELDSAQHRFGIASKEALTTLERIDARIGRIVQALHEAKIYDHTTLFVISDHGFTDCRKLFHPRALLARAKLITVSSTGSVTDWQVSTYGGGGSTAIILKDPKDKGSEQAALKLFQEYALRPNSPIYKIVTRSELDKLGAYPAAAFALDAATGYGFGYKLVGKELEDNPDKGCHGHLPSRAGLYASFIAAGRSIKQGVREPFLKNTAFAPTVAVLLGFELPSAEEKPAKQFLDLIK